MVDRTLAVLICSIQERQHSWQDRGCSHQVNACVKEQRVASNVALLFRHVDEWGQAMRNAGPPGQSMSCAKRVVTAARSAAHGAASAQARLSIAQSVEDHTAQKQCEGKTATGRRCFLRGSMRYEQAAPLWVGGRF